MVGNKFGRLTVIERAEDRFTCSGYKIICWKCKCECQNITIVEGKKLKSGHTRSCGCLQKENTSKRKKKYNTYDLSNNIGIGYTNSKIPFYFDREDYNKICYFCWNIDDNGYLFTHNGDKIIRLHQMILKVDENRVVDHKNGNKSDNRKENLRVASLSQNSQNHKLYKNNKSGVSGVRFNKDRNKWEASITYHKKAIFLGRFMDFNEAVNARKRAEDIYFGEFKRE